MRQTKLGKLFHCMGKCANPVERKISCGPMPKTVGLKCRMAPGPASCQAFPKKPREPSRSPCPFRDRTSGARHSARSQTMRVLLPCLPLTTPWLSRSRTASLGRSSVDLQPRRFQRRPAAERAQPFHPRRPMRPWTGRRPSRRLPWTWRGRSMPLHPIFLGLWTLPVRRSFSRIDTFSCMRWETVRDRPRAIRPPSAKVPAKTAIPFSMRLIRVPPKERSSQTWPQPLQAEHRSRARRPLCLYSMPTGPGNWAKACLTGLEAARIS